MLSDIYIKFFTHVLMNTKEDNENFDCSWIEKVKTYFTEFFSNLTTEELLEKLLSGLKFIANIVGNLNMPQYCNYILYLALLWVGIKLINWILNYVMVFSVIGLLIANFAKKQ